jgi:hypothetical protein
MGRRTTNTFTTIKDSSSRAAANNAGGKNNYSSNASPIKLQKATKPLINQNIFERVSKVTVFELPLGMGNSIQQTIVP